MPLTSNDTQTLELGLLTVGKTFKSQISKVAKHNPTIRWQFADELFECVWPFCGIGTYRVKHQKINTKL